MGTSKQGSARELVQALVVNQLFKGIPVDEYADALELLGAQVCSYEPPEQLVRLGDMVTKMGIIVSGKVRVGFIDEAGSQGNIDHLGPGDIFGEAMACARVPSIVQVDAETSCEVLWLDVSKAMGYSSTNPWGARITENLVLLLARKNLFLNRKMQTIAQKRLRDRIKMYLQDRCGTEGTTTEIPYSRTELARYLCVDRSALSREMGRMRDEGILRMEGNRIEVLHPGFLEG